MTKIRQEAEAAAAESRVVQLQDIKKRQNRTGDIARAAIPDAPQLSEETVANDQLSELASRIQVDPALPFYLASVEGRIIRVNEIYKRLVSACRDVLPAPGAPEQQGGAVSAAGAAIIAEVLRKDGTLVTDETLPEEHRVRHWRGRHFPIRNERGDVVGVAGTYQDVTTEVVARRDLGAVRQRFQDFARASSDWFWEMDRAGRLTSLSDRFTALTGQPSSLFLGQKLSDLGSLIDRNGHGGGMNAAWQRHAPFRDEIFEMQVDGMGVRRFHLSGVPVFDPQTGEFSGYRGSGKDITQQHRQEEEARAIRRNLEETLEELTRKNMQLDVASAEAESALRTKNEFLAAMSHELRTPLNAIIGFAETMQLQLFGNLDDRYLSYSGDILKAGRHLLGLINDVLDVAVLESGRMTLVAEACSLQDIIEEACQFVRQRAASKGINMDALTVPKDWTINVDQRRATQIFVNLLTNAIKFTPEGGVVGLDISEEAGGRLSATVWDTGIGIASDKHEAIFEKFHQVTDTIYSRKEEGTGLGLHISRELARGMGGDITLESAPRQGSRFTVTLPLI